MWQFWTENEHQYNKLNFELIVMYLFSGFVLAVFNS